MKKRFLFACSAVFTWLHATVLAQPMAVSAGIQQPATPKSNGISFEGTFEFPKDRMTLTNRWTMGSWDASWNINRIGKHGDDGIGYVGNYMTHDIQAGWNTPIKGLRLVLGAVNVTEKFPPLVSADTRAYSFALYDGYGRQVYGRVDMKF